MPAMIDMAGQQAKPDLGCGQADHCSTFGQRFRCDTDEVLPNPSGPPRVALEGVALQHAATSALVYILVSGIYRTIS
ncbi:MAG TPA: hypothetical protein VGC99_14755 [Candidatus Tectomicrobia bacterium]